MIRILIATLVLGTFATSAAVKNWTNTLGGDWFAAANWSPNGAPGNSDSATITNAGTYTVLVTTGTVTTAVLTIGGSDGTQTLIYGTTAGGQFFLTNSIVRTNGILTITNGGFRGALTIQPGGQLNLAGMNNLQLYSSALTNYGTVTWSSGSLSVGGSNSETTWITNGGLWQITGNGGMNYGGGSAPKFHNSGTLRKITDPGSSSLNLDLVNWPSGLVDVQSGLLQLTPFQTNILGGTFNVVSLGTINLWGGTFLDSGGAISGNGLMQIISGTLILRTNTLPGLKLSDGNIYLGTNTFQQSGAITNLTIDGAKLHGANQVAGTLTFNVGSIVDKLTVLPGGQLTLATGGSKLLYDLTLINQGTVAWSGGGLNVGGSPGTIISNAGSWIMTADGNLSYGGGSPAGFTNFGIVQKSAGVGTSAFSGVTFANQPSGIVQVDTGTLQFPNNYTNTAGTLRLNGGTFNSFSTLTLLGGTIDGTGAFANSTIISGGILSPGQSPGAIQFKGGLILNPNGTLVFEGTGTVPGTQYDQLSVSSSAAISNCTLQVTSLPAVPIGTVFTIITNTSGNTISGTFNGLPENALINVSGQLFRIHYNLSGKNVLLVRDSGAAAPQLSGNSYSNGLFRLGGSGGSSIIYTLQATTNFLQWTNIGAATSDLSGNFLFNDTNAFRFPYRFYRTTN